MPGNNHSIQLPSGLFVDLADAMQADSDISPTSSELASAFAEYVQSKEPDERKTLPELKQANDLLGRKIYDEAHAQYLRVIDSILGIAFRIPLPQDQDGGVKCEKYMQLCMDDRINLMACCNGIAKCLVGTEKRTEALDWFEEVAILDRNARFAKRPVLHDWEYYNPQPPRQDYYLERINGLLGASDVFLGMMNTGCATQRRCVADELINHAPAGVNIRPLRALCPSGSVQALLQWRHPDPQLQNGWEVRDEELQVRGSWQKIKISGNIHPRMGFATFSWKGRLYVCGGMKSGELTVYTDMHYMDLKRPGAWHELPQYPGPVFLNLQLVVHGDKAYSFNGKPRVLVFDLVTERWGRMQTSWVDHSGKPAPWPQEIDGISDYAMHVANGKIYVFGGTVDKAKMGCNFLAVLDLATKTWRHLSGFAGIPPADYDRPGPRKYVASWVDGKGEKIYLLQGMADRAASEMLHQAHAARDSHGYDDFWSWDIKARKWRRERMVGNTPCPRTEMACTYNPALDSTVVCGGYNPEVPTQFESGKCFGFTYYADTFVLDHSAARPRWRHVVHQGFPTYRAQSALITDPDTGRMYLFGGYTNTDQVPSGKDARTRSFRDLWELRLDVPGGHFDEVNLSDERSAQMGPWRKCFNCGNTGFWRKCGGSCNGRAFFCDEVCQREGWKEHKAFHNCRSKK